MRVGYVRVSSDTQNTARQDATQDLAGTERTFVDKVSGKDVAGRPGLVEMIAFVRDGDTVVVHSMDRLARNLEDLLSLVRQLTDKGVRVEFVKEALVFDGEDSPMSVLLLQLLGAVAQFERSLIRERQLEGIAAAKAEGRYRGRQPVLTPARAAELRDRDRANGGRGRAALAREFGISRSALYAYLGGGEGVDQDAEPADAVA